MKNKKAAIITLGCPKNTVESESAAGLFVKNNFLLTNNLKEADIILIHTCSFIYDARKESEQCIKDIGLLKKQKPSLKLFISGCLPQLVKNDLKERFPFIDGCVGTGALPNIIDLIKQDKYFCDTKFPGGLNDAKTRILSSNLPYAYVKIAEGCNHRCSFCIIPDLRGKYKSRSIKSIADEVSALAEFGIKEIILVAQDTTSYGIDIYSRYYLHKLFGRLVKIKNIKWIRLLYAYPSSVTNDLLEALSEYKNICRYIDMPVQHISKNILSKMQRPANTRKIVDKIKTRLPDFALRTSLITGFPSESRKDFEELKRYVKENLFEHIGIFSYSDQETARSYNSPDKISIDVANERKQILANLQFANVQKNNALKTGKEYDVLIENIKGNKIYARAEFQAPEIDSNIIIKLKKNQTINSPFVKAAVTGSKDYDIEALLV